MADPCLELSTEPYIHYEIVKMGKNPNVTFSHGTIVRVICAQGYRLNIGTNNTAKCSRGRWKPKRPNCEVRKYSCFLKFTFNVFTLSTSQWKTYPNEFVQ